MTDQEDAEKCGGQMSYIGTECRPIGAGMNRIMDTNKGKLSGSSI